MVDYDKALWERLRQEYRRKTIEMGDKFDESVAIEFIKTMFKKYAKQDVNDYVIVDGPIEAMKEAKKLGYTNDVPVSWHGNAFDFLWQARYQYDIEAGLEEPHGQLEEYIDFSHRSNLAGGVYNYKKGIIMKPFTKLCIDDRMRLHNDTGPSVTAADGFELYCLDDIAIPKDIFVSALVDKTATGTDILGIKDVEQRTVLMKYYGIDNMFDHLGGKLVETMEEPSHVDGAGCSYELWDIKYDPGDSQPVIPLKVCIVECHSEHKRTPLIVPAEMKNIRQAVAWTFDPHNDKGWVDDPSLYWDNMIHQS